MSSWTIPRSNRPILGSEGMHAANAHNIYSVFESVARRRGNHTAVIYLGTRFSYGTLRKMAESLASALVEQGVTPGQRVMIYLPNSIQWVVAWLGIQRAGGGLRAHHPDLHAPRPALHRQRQRRRGHHLRRHEFRLCPAGPGRHRSETGRRGRDGRSASLVETGLRLPLRRRSPKARSPSATTPIDLKKLLRRDPGTGTCPPFRPMARPSAEILYTGGTTKFPKGVPITHDLFLVSADEQIRVSDSLIPVEENVILGNAPLFHILGQTCSLATLLVGGRPAASAQNQPGRRLRRHQPLQGARHDRRAHPVPNDPRT